MAAARREPQFSFSFLCFTSADSTEVSPPRQVHLTSSGQTLFRLPYKRSSPSCNRHCFVFQVVLSITHVCKLGRPSTRTTFLNAKTGSESFCSFSSHCNGPSWRFVAIWFALSTVACIVRKRGVVRNPCDWKRLHEKKEPWKFLEIVAEVSILDMIGEGAPLRQSPGLDVRQMDSYSRN